MGKVSCQTVFRYPKEELVLEWIPGTLFLIDSLIAVALPLNESFID